ncbi:MAG TPA: SH3 domain-containing protein [Nitrosomonas halophila]|nr:SH3 domain-containing protein [Nitrosomonas halophila]
MNLKKVSMLRFHLHCSSNERLPMLAVVILTALSLAGCAQHMPKSFSSDSAFDAAFSPETAGAIPIPIPEQLPCARRYQDEIHRLRHLLAERDELIRRLSARELDQAQALQKTASEVSRTKSQLHRLATQPEAASKIAEVEIELEMLQQTVLDDASIALQLLAQRLLDAASIAYRQMDYSHAMNYAAQAREFINMTMHLAGQTPEAQSITVILRTPMALLTAGSGELWAEPSDRAQATALLPKNTALTATAYHGSWLRVQTEDGRTGWIRNTMVDIRLTVPDFQS